MINISKIIGTYFENFDYRPKDIEKTYKGIEGLA